MRKNSPLTGWPSNSSHLLRQIAPRDRAEQARGLAGGHDQVGDELIDGVELGAPAAAHSVEAGATVHAPLATDDAFDPPGTARGFILVAVAVLGPTTVTMAL